MTLGVIQGRVFLIMIVLHGMCLEMVERKLLFHEDQEESMSSVTGILAEARSSLAASQSAIEYRHTDLLMDKTDLLIMVKIEE